MAKKMKPPTLEECQEYAEGMSLQFCDPEEFFFYYESIGWKVGRGKGKLMESWRRSMSGWNARNRRRGDKPRRVPIRPDPSFEGRF
jgi:hypothetical protein